MRNTEAVSLGSDRPRNNPPPPVDRLAAHADSLADLVAGISGRKSGNITGLVGTRLVSFPNLFTFLSRCLLLRIEMPPTPINREPPKTPRSQAAAILGRGNCQTDGSASILRAFARSVFR